MSSSSPSPTREPQHLKAEPMRAAKRPLAPGLVGALGVLWALALVALAVVCLHDALDAFGALHGKPWIDAATKSLDGLFPADWMYVAGAVCIVAGLLLLTAAVKPRPRRGIELEATTSVLASKSAVRRLASTAARDVDGVDTASASASRRRVTVDATVLSSTQAAAARASISEAVDERLSALRARPRIRVRVKSIGGDQ